jgi:hypothetical protein
MPGTRAAIMWPGREADAPLRTPRSRQSPFCQDESRPDMFVVGVGIEPTFRVFQTRANPSQLSDRSGARGETRTHEYWICNPVP